MSMDVGDLFSQSSIQAEPESRLWIEGRSNINQFECVAGEYKARATLGDEVEDQTLAEIPSGNLQIYIKIPVREFDCGRSRMNRDFYETMKSEEHPHISFTYQKAVTQQVPENPDDPWLLEVHGDLSIAGTTLSITFGMKGYLMHDGKMRAIGKKPLRMTDYNIEPPTGLFGLIRAQDELTVHFDLYASRMKVPDKSKSGR
ncbi:MAG: YceI family protein [Balneolaceae bacterium]